MTFVQQIVQQTGIQETQAQQAVTGLTEGLTGSLPAPLTDLIGGLLSGSNPLAGQDGAVGADDLMALLGGGQAGGQNDLMGSLSGLVGGLLGGQGGGLNDLVSGLLGGANLNLDSLTQMVAEKAGIGQDVAGSIIQMAVTFLSEKLGPEVGGMLQGLLGGAAGAGNSGNAGFGLDDIVGGLFGGNR